MDTTAAGVRRTVDVAAPAERVWEIVSDLPAMGALSPENRGGRWLGGVAGPQQGATFRGVNGRGLRRWATTSRVVRCEPPSVFAFQVSSLGRPVAEWRFDIEPTAAGCRVSESWRDLRAPLDRAVGAVATGVRDRAAFTATSIAHTLERVKATAEHG